MHSSSSIITASSSTVDSIHRRLRIFAIEQRDEVRECFHFIDFKSVLLGASLMFVLPRAFSFVQKQLVDFRIRQLLRRPHRAAGGCTTGSSKVRVLNKKGFCLGYSDELRTSLWASFFTCARAASYSSCSSASGSSKKMRGRNAESKTRKLQTRFDFRSDVDIPEQFRTTGNDFSGTSLDAYERGHLVAAANLLYSDDAAFDCSKLSNVVLQHRALNRGAWYRAEKLVRVWTHSLRPQSPLAVAVGPLFHSSSKQQQQTSSCKRLPPVPSAFFIAVLHTRSGKCIAFVIENSQRGGNAPLANAQVTVNALERMHNLRIFRDLPFWYRPLPWQRRRVDSEFWMNKSRSDASAAAESTKKKAAVTVKRRRKMVKKKQTLFARLFVSSKPTTTTTTNREQTRRASRAAQLFQAKSDF